MPKTQLTIKYHGSKDKISHRANFTFMKATVMQRFGSDRHSENHRIVFGKWPIMTNSLKTVAITNATAAAAAM